MDTTKPRPALDAGRGFSGVPVVRVWRLTLRLETAYTGPAGAVDGSRLSPRSICRRQTFIVLDSLLWPSGSPVITVRHAVKSCFSAPRRRVGRPGLVLCAKNVRGEPNGGAVEPPAMILRKFCDESAQSGVNTRFVHVVFFLLLRFADRKRSYLLLDQLEKRLLMPSVLNTRISGKVVHTERQSFGSGEKAFKFLEVHVQTSVASITPVRFTDRSAENGLDTPRAGDAVDLEVQISGFSGRSGLDLSATAIRSFDESYYLEAAGVAA